MLYTSTIALSDTSKEKKSNVKIEDVGLTED